jgi:hypothetical protein
MKLFIFILAFLAISMAQAQVLADKCAQVAGQYLVRGDLKSPFGGDRLWSLDRIQRDFQADTSEECLSEIRSSALNDAKEYWSGFVAAKYSCNGEDSLTPPPQKPEACPDDKWAAIQENLTYIKAIETGKLAPSAPTNARVKSKPQAPCDKARGPLADVKEISAALPQPPAVVADPCAKYGIKKEHLKSTPPKDKNSDAFFTCLNGAKQGLKSLADSFKSSYEQLAKFVKDPAYRASVMSAVSDLATILATSPLQAANAIRDSLIMNITEYKGEFQCLNSDGVNAELCKQIASKGLPALLGVGSIRAIAMLLKTGKRLTPGLIAIRNASQAAEKTKALGAPPKLLANSAAKATSEAADEAKTASKAGNTAREKAQAKASERADAAKRRNAEAEAKAKAEADAEAKKKAEYEAAAKTSDSAREKATAKARATMNDLKKRKEEAEALAKRNNIDLKRDAALIERLKTADIKTFEQVQDFLGLPRTSSRAEAKKILKAYFQKFHRDRNPDFPKESGEASSTIGQMMEITDRRE